MIRRSSRFARPSSSRAVLVATGLAVSVLITACSGDESGTPEVVVPTSASGGSVSSAAPSGSAADTSVPDSSAPASSASVGATESAAADATESAAADATESAAADATESASADATESASAEASGSNPARLPDTTDPGTQLKLGEPMVAEVGIGVTGTENGSTYVQYTVDEIEKGDQQVLDKISDKRGYEGGTVYYVRGTMQVLAVLGDAGDSLVTGAVVGIQDDGKGAASTFGIGDVSDDCTGSFVLENPAVGDTEQTCIVALAKKGTTVVGAAFIRDGTVPAGGTSDDPYYNNAVLWLG